MSKSELALFVFFSVRIIMTKPARSRKQIILHLSCFKFRPIKVSLITPVIVKKEVRHAGICVSFENFFIVIETERR